MEIHNTALKKQANDLVGNNIQDAPIDQIDPTMKMVVVNEPYISVIRTLAATGTIYTTPSDKEFYLVGAAISANGDLTGDTKAIVAFPADQSGSVSVLSATHQISNSVNISTTYGMRGIKLAKSSPITANSADSGLQTYTIWGYLGDDRN